MDKKLYLQNTFKDVAAGYDHPALSFFPQTAQLMIEKLSLRSDTELLDVCAGTGVVALAAASSVPKMKITAIDLSEDMLNQAQDKADKAGLENIDFIQMDLDYLTFPKHQFDYASCSFGLFFLDDMAQGLQNIADRVKPSGKVAISSFAQGAFEPMSGLLLSRYEKYGYEVPPLSWKKITEEEQLTDLFKRAGMTDLEIVREPLGFKMSSALDWWDIVWNAGYRGLLSQMTADEVAQFKTEHLAEVQALYDSGQEWMDTGVVIAIGTR